VSGGTNGNGTGRSPAAWLRKSIQARLVVSVCAASALLLGALEVLQLTGFPAIGLQGRLATLRAEASRRLSLTADYRKEKVLSTLVEFRKDVEILAGEDAVRSSTATLCRAVTQQGLEHSDPSAAWHVLKSRDDYQALERAFRRVQEISGAYEAIHIIDLATSRVCFSTEADLLGTDKSAQPYFQVASHLAGGYVSETGSASYAPVPVSRACCLIRDSSGASVALLALVINMDLVVRPLLETGPELGRSAEAVLMNEQTTIVTSLSHPLRDGSIAQPLVYRLDTVPAHMAARGEEGLVEAIDYRGIPVLAAVRHIRLTQDWGWGLEVKIDQAELFAPAADARRTLVLSSAGVLLLSLLVSLLMRRIAEPVRAIAGVATRFAEGDRSARSGIHGPDDVGRLARAFDSMAQAIDTSWNVLEERNTELASLTDALATRDRVREGLLAVSAATAASKSLEELASRSLAALATATRSQVGILYVATDESGRSLALAGSFGVARRQDLSPAVTFGEGQVGAAAEQRVAQIVRGVPAGTPLAVATALGVIPPAEITSIPLLLRDSTVGVVTLAALSPIDSEGLRIVEAVSPTLAVAIENARAHAKTAELAEELSAANEELQAQAEELRQAAEEIGLQRQQVMEADRLKSEFLSNMSHELRTPLNSILALSQLMITRGPGTSPEVDRQHLAIVERNGRQLLDLINDILDLSKIEAGRMEVARQEFEVGAVLADVEQTIAPLAREKGLDFRVDPARVGRMQSDPEKLRQILLNVVGNAVKFTDRGRVRLTVTEEDALVRFVVDDTGIGIPADELPSIFDEFRQVDGSTTRRYGGTGLGLAISRRLARLLGGDIGARSTEGVGSTFTVELPRSIPRSPASADRRVSGGDHHGNDAAEPEPTPPGHAAVPARVLVVDDNEVAAHQIRTLLAESGLDVEVADSGAAALAEVGRQLPDGIVLDLMMPRVDGFQVLEAIRANPWTRSVPVLVLTAKDLSTADWERLASGGVRYLIQKGRVDRAALVQAVEALVGRGAQGARAGAQQTPLGADRAVLIVEDNPDNRTAIRASLEAVGIHCIEANSADAALRAAEAGGVSVIVSDIQLPGTSGIDLPCRLRANPRLRGTRLLALTARAMKGDRETILAGGFDAYLAKPFDPAELQREVIRLREENQ
jgi:signal transduction histidine kinase/CheY-like chemotaxis protein/HAMP domain-containing protein